MAVKMTNQDLSDAVAGMTVDEMLDQVNPLISKYARWNVPGFDREDLHQELSVVAWRCQKAYDRTKGSFINVLIRSFENRLGNLRNVSHRQVQPIVGYACEPCETSAPHLGGHRRPLCPTCSRPMEATRNQYGPASLDAKAEVSAFEVTDENAEQPFQADDQTNPLEERWRRPDARWREGLEPGEVSIIETVLEGDRKLTPTATARLREIYPLVHGLL